MKEPKFHYEIPRVFVKQSFNVCTYRHIAKELGYSKECLQRLNECKTHEEATRILKGARNGEY